MASVTVSTLLSRVRERADMVGSSFVTNTANGLYAWLNEANQKLHGMLVDALGEEFVSSSSAFNTVVGTSDYAISGLYKLYGIDVLFQGNYWALQPYVRSERNVYRNLSSSYEIPRYSLIGSSIRLYPVPSSVLPCTVLYAPEATVLTTGADTVNYPNGWERFIVIDTAIQVLAKEESSVTTLTAERALIIKEIELAKESRDLANPKRVVETDLIDQFEVNLW